MAKKNHIIMGTAISVAALAVAIDHMHHRLPEPAQDMSGYIIEGDSGSGGSPCSLGGSPCGLGDSQNQSPCSLDSSPCSL